jgi:hypothetical protein
LQIIFDMNLGPKGEYNFITCLHHLTPFSILLGPSQSLPSFTMLLSVSDDLCDTTLQSGEKLTKHVAAQH